jgi:xanthine dehydrogenase iron-sulfur cluster and FAD-binding subunit A
MIMSCKVLLDANPRPSRAEIRTAVAGNLCRCGTYPHVIDAVEQASGVRMADLGADRDLQPSTFNVQLLHDDPRVASATLEVMEVEEA